MPAHDGALIARARGIATHLMARSVLTELAGAGDLESFARDLKRRGADLDPIEDPGDIGSVDRAIARTAARHLATLARWQRAHSGVLTVFHADLDRRAVRALIRGAAQGAPVATRLEGLAPTPSLPLRALTDLAHDESAAAVVKHLVLLRYPDAVSLLPLARQVHPDLLAVDVVLLRAFARESCAAAARGDRYLRQYVAELIDICNLQIALLAAASHDVVPDAIFVNGGRWLSAQVLTAAVRAPSREMATSVLRSTIARSPLASLPLATADPARLDRAFLADALGRYARFARLEPLSSAAVLVVLLRLEAQSRDLRAIAWGAALHTPPALRRQMLVTPS